MSKSLPATRFTISVIITTFNRASLLVSCLDSVLAQTRQPQEIVVIDDGSTDETASVVKQYGKEMPDRVCLTYCYQENAHLSAARNHGLRVASSDFVLFLDDDDQLLPEALSNLAVRLFRRQDAVLAYGRSQTVSWDGTPMDKQWRFGNEVTYRDLWQALAQQNFIRTPGCALVRKEAMIAVGEWDTNLRSLEDWDMWLRLARPPGARFVRHTGTVLRYRVHPGGMSANRGTMYEMRRRMYQKHLREVPTGDWRASILTALLDRYPPLPAGTAPSLSEDDVTSPRHGRLRTLLTRSGIAPLYRHLPYGVRVRVGQLFGINYFSTGSVKK